jgi:hypothetical protein
MAIEGYITVNRMFQDTIVVNHLFEEELQIQRSELFDEFDSIRELFRIYSAQDPSESLPLPLAAVVFFIEKTQHFTRKIIAYHELTNELLDREVSTLSNKICKRQ